MAKAVVPSLDAVPEALRSEYEKQADGTFALKLEGTPLGFVSAKDYADLNGKIIEFRDTNTKLLKALGADSVDSAVARAAAVAGIDTAKLEKLKAIDPAEYEALKMKVGKLKDKGVDDPDELETRFKAILETSLKGVNDKLEASERARTEAQGRADRALLRQTIGEKFQKAGGKTSALDFIVDKAPFRVVDNAVKAQEGKYSAKDGHSPLEMDEWLAGVVKEYDFAFEPSKGGGAAHGNGNGTGSRSQQTSTFRAPGGGELKTDGIEVLS